MDNSNFKKYKTRVRRDRSKDLPKDRSKRNQNNRSDSSAPKKMSFKRTPRKFNRRKRNSENSKQSEFYRNDYFFETKPAETIVIDSNPEISNFGNKPKDRPIEEYIKKGVVVINKPSGPTSHEIAAYVKQILNVKTAGHSGSLDPVVTGVQPVMIDYATRAVGAIRLSGKEYICVLRLHKTVPANTIKKTISEFTGSVYQMPPVTSAVKRRLRTRKIYYIDILEIFGKDVLIKVGCEAGTYIRKLCHDIGLALGTGAHMQELIRSKAGPFDETNITTLQELTDAVYYWKNCNDESLIRNIILPMESAFSHLPKITVRDSAVGALANGAALAKPGIVSFTSNVEKGQLVAVFSQKGEIISLSRSQMNADDIKSAESGIVAKPISVYMPIGIYPNVWNKKETDFSRKSKEYYETKATEKEFLKYYKSLPPAHYPKPALSVDSVVLKPNSADSFEILLIKRKKHPSINKWALPGGFLNPDETVGEAARRELLEETGLDIPINDFDQVRAFSDPKRDPRGRNISIAHAVVLKENQIAEIKSGDDAKDARMFEISKTKPLTFKSGNLTITESELAFDHADIIKTAINWVKNRSV